MTAPDNRPTAPRSVRPRSWTMLATTAALTAAAPVVPMLATATMAHAQEAGEAGESGEAAVSHGDGVEALLTEMGLFEAAHLIPTALYLRGGRDEALEQFDGAHHAYYEDLATELAEAGVPGFGDEARAFADALHEGLSDETVEARFHTLIAAIARARGATQASLHQQIMAMKRMLDVAAADFAGGVENGEILSEHEYRDAWGFVETVRARASALAASDDADTAQAGTEVLAQLDGLASLFPGLSPEAAPGDPGRIAAAAAWVEIIALRHR
jgi:hypothetical protein